jgi:hypothetical protein
MNTNNVTGTGTNSTQLGDNACAFSQESVSIGQNSIAGKSIEIQNPYSVAIGYSSNSSGRSSISIGNESSSSSLGAISIGNECKTSESGAIAIGYKSNASEIHSIAIGDAATSNKQTSFALGYHSNSTGKHSVAIGDQANAIGGTSFSLGYHTNAIGNHSCALGDQANASGVGSLSIGYKSNASGKNSVAIGINSNASHENSIAIGPNSETTAKDQICLGNSDSIISIPGDLKVNNGGTYYSLLAKDATSDETAAGDFVGQFSYTSTYARIWDGSQWKKIGSGLTEVPTFSSTYQYTNNPGLNLHKTLEAYNTEYKPTGFNVYIAILSDGIPPTNVSVSQKVICGGNFGGEQPDLYKNIGKDSEEEDDYWLGVSLASISSGYRLKDFQINMDTNNPINIKNSSHGYAFDSKIVDIRTIDDKNEVIDTLNWNSVETDIINAGADIILQTHDNIMNDKNQEINYVDNFKLSSETPSNFDLTNILSNLESQRTFLKNLQDNNKIQVWPAGDFSHRELELLAGYPWVCDNRTDDNLTNANKATTDAWISVVSVDENGIESSYTNRAGRCSDFTVAAHGANVPFAFVPGTGIGYGYDNTTLEQNSFHTIYNDNSDLSSGNNTPNSMIRNNSTSFAAAAVAGAIAIVAEAKQNKYSAKQVVQLILNTASYDGLSIRCSEYSENNLESKLNQALNENNIDVVEDILLGDKYGDDSNYSNTEGGKLLPHDSNHKSYFTKTYDEIKTKIGQTSTDDIFKKVFGKGLINIEEACNANI